VSENMRKKILVVTGSTLRAEECDRPLAYRVKGRIDELCGGDTRKHAIVMSDIWYLNNKVLQSLPVISVGGPSVNAVSALLFQKHLPYALAVDNTFIIQMDVSFKDCRAAIWGTNHETTEEAVEIFLKEDYIGRFVRAMWQRSEKDKPHNNVESESEKMDYEDDDHFDEEEDVHEDGVEHEEWEDDDEEEDDEEDEDEDLE